MVKNELWHGIPAKIMVFKNNDRDLQWSAESIAALSTYSLLSVKQMDPFYIRLIDMNSQINSCLVSTFFLLLIVVWFMGKRSEKGDPDVPFPSNFHQRIWGEHQDIPEPAKRYNLFTVSWVCCGVSSLMSLFESSLQGGISIPVDTTPICQSHTPFSAHSWARPCNMWS